MDRAELLTLLAGLRRTRAEAADVEVKAAIGGLPRTVTETASAFLNTRGGLLLLGVSEENDFVVVDLPDPRKLRDDLVSALSDNLDPPARLVVDLIDVEGGVVVVAEFEPLPPDQRPCFVKTRGIAQGSFVRVGDGDRRMTQTEIGLTLMNRSQPRYDLEPVPGTDLGHLDKPALARTLERARAATRALREVDDTTALHRLKVLAMHEGAEVVTLAGLLTFGEFPQEYFPQLMVSFVVHPPTATDRSDGAPRFLDNLTVRGSIPEIVNETLAAVRRNIAVRAYVDGTGRLDQTDYPLEAVREALVNALLHRDYSPLTRGTQVQVEIHPDRLVVRSPGGLFGPVTVADLGEEDVSASRNGYLAQLLSDTYLPHSPRVIAENRASGIPTMFHEMRRSGLGSPRFRDSPARFEVVLYKSELMDGETRRWIDEVRRPGFAQLHDLALAMLAHGQEVTNADLREYGAERSRVTQVLGELVAAGLATRLGGRRYARYILAAPRRPQPDDLFTFDDDELDGRSTYDAVVAAFGVTSTVTAAELAQVTGRSRPSVLEALRALVDEGLVRADGAQRSPRRSYTWLTLDDKR